MRRVFALLLLASGCTVNEAELRAIHTGLEKHLARAEGVAQEVRAAREELGKLEQQFVALGGALPPVTIRERRPRPAVSLPPVSPLEDADAARLREQIAQTQRMLAELDSILGDIEYLSERQQLLEEKLRQLEPR